MSERRNEEEAEREKIKASMWEIQQQRDNMFRDAQVGTEETTAKTL